MNVTSVSTSVYSSLYAGTPWSQVGKLLYNAYVANIPNEKEGLDPYLLMKFYCAK